MTPAFNLPVQAVRGASKKTTLIVDARHVAVGGFCGDQHADLAASAAIAINARADLAAMLRQARREYGVTTRLSGETLIEIDRVLAGLGLSE